MDGLGVHPPLVPTSWSFWTRVISVLVLDILNRCCNPCVCWCLDKVLAKSWHCFSVLVLYWSVFSYRIPWWINPYGSPKSSKTNSMNKHLIGKWLSWRLIAVSTLFYTSYCILCQTDCLGNVFLYYSKGIRGACWLSKKLCSVDVLVETSTLIYLKNIPKSEILAGFSSQGVFAVWYISSHVEGIMLPPSFLGLTLTLPWPPVTIKPDYLNCKVQPYIPNRLCFHCHTLSQSRASCCDSLTRAYFSGKDNTFTTLIVMVPTPLTFDFALSGWKRKRYSI